VKWSDCKPCQSRVLLIGCKSREKLNVKLPELCRTLFSSIRYESNFLFHCFRSIIDHIVKIRDSTVESAVSSTQIQRL
jgi:hypothetical protein